MRCNRPPMIDNALFEGILQSLPPSLQDFNLQIMVKWGCNTLSAALAPSRSWTFPAIRRVTITTRSRGYESRSYEPRIILSILRSCPQLEELTIPAISPDHAKDLMRTLATACPRLSRLKLDAPQLATNVPGNECLYFPQLQQTFSVLWLDIYNDRENVVLPTILAYSAGTLQELSLTNAAWLKSLDMAVILRSCPKLRFLKVQDFYGEVERPMTSITLQDLVEVPWACTHLDHLELVVADARDFSTVEKSGNDADNGEDCDEGRRETARLVLQLHRQIQSLEGFRCYCRFLFYSPQFDTMSMETGLRYMDGQATKDDLVRLGLHWY
ncbi:hypothetical protein BGZ70_007799 [Mortierella alpina]|uniref:Uncharacterized protein n=1 Tax=Mortierella alpina TaxID=64518 RepID=A0A9P6J514_MORAP|nr:hypothetical protein BGZ70_007799 [Mortierella alpina]